MFEDNLFEWNSLKKKLENEPEPYNVAMTYFSALPRLTSDINPWDIGTWHDQWTLLKYNKYDEFTIPLAMAYAFSSVKRFNNDIIQLWLVSKLPTFDKYYFMVINDYILNYNDTVLHRKNLDEQFVIERVYYWDNDTPRCPKILKTW